MAKRRIIMRRSDWDKYPKTELAKYVSGTFTPFYKEWFERRATYYALKAKQAYIADQYALVEYPHVMLAKMTQFRLHDARYPSWLLRWDAQGQLLIKAGLRFPESEMGYVTFVEKEVPKK